MNFSMLTRFNGARVIRRPHDLKDLRCELAIRILLKAHNLIDHLIAKIGKSLLIRRELLRQHV